MTATLRESEPRSPKQAVAERVTLPDLAGPVLCEETTQLSSINHSGFPHLVDLIVSHSPYESLLVLRKVSRDMRDQVDGLMAQDIEFSAARGDAQILEPIVQLRTAGARGIPALYPNDCIQKTPTQYMAGWTITQRTRDLLPQIRRLTVRIDGWQHEGREAMAIFSMGQFLTSVQSVTYEIAPGSTLVVATFLPAAAGKRDLVVNLTEDHTTDIPLGSLNVSLEFLCAIVQHLNDLHTATIITSCRCPDLVEAHPPLGPPGHFDVPDGRRILLIPLSKIRRQFANMATTFVGFAGYYSCYQPLFSFATTTRSGRLRLPDSDSTFYTHRAYRAEVGMEAYRVHALKWQAPYHMCQHATLNVPWGETSISLATTAAELCREYCEANDLEWEVMKGKVRVLYEGETLLDNETLWERGVLNGDRIQFLEDV